MNLNEIVFVLDEEKYEEIQQKNLMYFMMKQLDFSDESDNEFLYTLSRYNDMLMYYIKKNQNYTDTFFIEYNSNYKVITIDEFCHRLTKICDQLNSAR